VRRRRLALASGLVLLLLALALLALGLLRGGNGPAEGAAKLVPADALAYVHLSTDEGRAATRRAGALARRFPSYGRLRDRLLSSVHLSAPGQGAALARDVRPWIGKEAALALVPLGERAVALTVLDVRSRESARRFLTRFGRPTAQPAYRGVPTAVYGAQAAAFVSHYLVIGPPAALEEAIDAQAGRRPALAAQSAYRRAMKRAPDARVAELYASSAGVRQVLVPRGGLLGTVGGLLDQPALAGAVLTLSAQGDGARARAHTVLDSGQAAPPSPFAPFAPSLPDRAPGPATAWLQLSGIGRAGARLVGAVPTGGAGARIAAFLGQLGQALSARGVDVKRDVLPVLQGEFALEITPGVPLPTLTLIARTRDEASARAAFAQLQGPLAQIFAPPGSGPGVAPTFTEETVAGVEVFRLRLSAARELDYAVFDGQLVASTSLQGIAAVRSAGGRLASDGDFRAATAERPQKVTSLVFLDFRQLLGLIEQTGLGHDPRFRASRADLARIRSAGLTSSHGESDSTVELNLKIP